MCQTEVRRELYPQLSKLKSSQYFTPSLFLETRSAKNETRSTKCKTQNTALEKDVEQARELFPFANLLVLCTIHASHI